MLRPGVLVLIGGLALGSAHAAPVDARADHWAYKRPVRPPVPVAPSAGVDVGNEIDAFVRARLEGTGLQPSPMADRPTLIRRVTLDLTGLPPLPSEVDAFVNDRSVVAWEKVVDRLLASPRFGERMAQDWLDAARFADTNGYQVDRDREMWAWRDWVVTAFNRNLPFDQFTVEQLAGDLLPDATMEQRIATGFHRNHMINEEGGIIPEEFLNEYCADRVETTATVWLGQTFNCARCHDHKYDPFTQRDFYGLYAFFNNITEKGAGDYGVPFRRASPPFVDLPAPELDARIVRLKGELGTETAVVARAVEDWESRARATGVSVGKPAKDGAEPARLPEDVTTILGKATKDRSAAELKRLEEFRLADVPAQAEANKRLAGLRQQAADAENSRPVTLVMAERDTPRDTFVLKRGVYDQHLEPVKASTPAGLPPMPADLPRNRLGLARWLVDPANPLTARVTVNRFWQSVFGTGLVRTSEDFGTRGEAPSHPELLDWLATEFVRRGWDIKAMIRLMATSATYRQDSRATAASRALDPENRLLARGARYRLSAEAIRDQALAASGLMVGQLGGPSVKPYHPPGLYEQVVSGSSAESYVMDHGAALYRRTLYTYWKRSVPNPALLLFDRPFRESCVVRRSRTSTPLQALNVLNDPTHVEAARALAVRMMREGGAGVEARIRHGFRCVTAREPKPAELAILVAGWTRNEAGFRREPAAAADWLKVGESKADPRLDAVAMAAYAVTAATILNLDEALTRE